MEGEFFVVLPEGKIEELKEYHFDMYPYLREIYEDELKIQKVRGESAHIKLMKKYHIAMPEPVSDAGCLSYLPNGAFLVEMLRRLAWEEVVEKLGAYPIITPAIIQEDLKEVKWLIEHFPERHYRILPGKEEKEKKLFLKTAGDYGSFSLHRYSRPSYRDLPYALFEFETDYRYEQRGEIRGMHRLREFRMINVHTLCKDEKEAWQFFWKIFNALINVLKRFKVDLDTFAIYGEKEFVEKYKEDLIKFAKEHGKPIFMRLMEKGKLYMTIWIDGIVFDSVGHPMEIVTTQFDPRSAKEWDIIYYDEEGKEKYPYIIHAGIGVDRTIAALLELMARKKKKVFPIEISPIQVRLMPISEKYNEYAYELAKKMKEYGIRVDVDDRAKRLEKKIAIAERYFIPLIAVIGKEEVEKGTLKIRDLEKREVKEYKVEEFIELLKRKIKDYPLLRGFGKLSLETKPSNIW